MPFCSLPLHLASTALSPHVMGGLTQSSKRSEAYKQDQLRLSQAGLSQPFGGFTPEQRSLIVNTPQSAHPLGPNYGKAAFKIGSGVVLFVAGLFAKLPVVTLPLALYLDSVGWHTFCEGCLDLKASRNPQFNPVKNSEAALQVLTRHKDKFPEYSEMVKQWQRTETLFKTFQDQPEDNAEKRLVEQWRTILSTALSIVEDNKTGVSHKRMPQLRQTRQQLEEKIGFSFPESGHYDRITRWFNRPMAYFLNRQMKFYDDLPTVKDVYRLACDKMNSILKENPDLESANVLLMLQQPDWNIPQGFLPVHHTIRVTHAEPLPRETLEPDEKSAVIPKTPPKPGSV